MRRAIREQGGTGVSCPNRLKFLACPSSSLRPKSTEMSALSLRTVQRLERRTRQVSYGSLRAVAAADKIHVDLLDRELNCGCRAYR
jgi:hypothetical protein